MCYRFHTVALAEQERQSVGQSLTKSTLDADAAESCGPAGHGRDRSGTPRPSAATAHS